MQTINYDPATHVLVPREPTKVMVRAGYEYTGTTQSEVRATYKEMIALAPAPPQTSCTEKSYDCREALKWTAAALSALAKIHKAHADDRFVMDNDEHKSIREILDMASAVLEPK